MDSEREVGHRVEAAARRRAAEPPTSDGAGEAVAPPGDPVADAGLGADGSATPSAPADGAPRLTPAGGDDAAAAVSGGGDTADGGGTQHFGDDTAAVVEELPPLTYPPVVDVVDLDWEALRRAADPAGVRARLRTVVERFEDLLDRAGGAAMLFDDHRAGDEDRAIRVAELDPATPLWFVGDLHGDLLGLEAALALARKADGDAARLVFLGDLFDDGGYGVEVLLRVLELVLEDPARICVLAGNHDEALGYDGSRFTAAVSPADFSELLNGELAHEWLVRAGKLAVRLFARAPRALFLPDGLLVAHGGIPLVDLHPELRATGDWNDPRCLDDFVWTRAHPRARRKMPNRAARGSQFGREDFADFCALASELGRQVARMVRGHDHVEERYAIYEAYAPFPLLTIVTLSRRLDREAFGPFERAPCVARWVAGTLPQVHRLCIPGALVRELYETAEHAAGEGNER